MIRRPEFYSAPDSTFNTAFKRVSGIYERFPHHNPADLKKLTPDIARNLFGDYCFASCAFLKNHLMGTTIEDIGQAAWIFVEYPSSRLIITNDLRETLTRPDIDANGQIRGLRTPPSQPKMLLDENKHNPDETSPIMLITPDFVIKAQQQPADVIAETAAAISYFSDWTEEKILRTSDARLRSQTVKAAVLVQAQKEDPNLVLSAANRVLVARYTQVYPPLPQSVDF